VQYAATQPGDGGAMAAFAAEWLLSFLLMLVVRVTSLSKRWSPWTGVCVGIFIMLAVMVESPVADLSLNPTRTLCSSVWARNAEGLWVYLLAPPLGMMCAAEVTLGVARALRKQTLKRQWGRGLWRARLRRGSRSGAPPRGGRAAVLPPLG
jgi:glycerol uptake facilitator-like aquaporin